MNEKKNGGPLTREGMGIQAGMPLELAGEGIDDIRRGVQMLLNIEAIRNVKHAYFRCLDTANWEEMSELFHEDVKVHFVGGNYEWKIEGKEDYLQAIQSSYTRESVGHHNGHHPEIQILADDEATGVWYLADNMWVLNHNFFTTGTAIYWDRYLKVDGRWKIRETRYERIYEISHPLEKRPPLSSHYLGTYGTEIDSGSG